MSIKLKGSSDGSVSLDAPADTSPSGTDVTLTLPTSAGSANQVLKNSGTAGTLEYSSMVEDSSGRLLVGTSTARTTFFSGGVTASIQAEGTSANTGTVAIIRNDTNEPGILVLGSSGGTSNGSNTLTSNGASAGVISFQATDGTDFTEAARITTSIDNAPSDNDMPGRLEFMTTADGASAPTERMRINRLGHVNIGSTADNLDTRLYLVGATADSSGYATVIRNSSLANLMYIRNDAHFFCDCIYNQTTAAGANVHIDGAARLLRVTSSLKYKTNVETLEDSYADAILNVRPIWYQSLGANDNPDWGWWGFIAEEVAEIDPRLVSWKTTEVVNDENGEPSERPLETPEPDGVHYERFVPHLLNLIKRQQQAIETLEAKVAALEAAA